MREGHEHDCWLLYVPLCWSDWESDDNDDDNGKFGQRNIAMRREYLACEKIDKRACFTLMQVM